MSRKQQKQLIRSLLYLILTIAVFVLFSFNFLADKGYLDFLPSDQLQAIGTISHVSISLWWLWIFLILFFVGRNIWLTWRYLVYKKSIPWDLLEIRIPREVRRPPRAMEQVFMAIYSLMNSAGDFNEKWWDGEVTLWFCAEIVSFGGDTRFYMRVPRPRRNVVEAALYAQYQDIEIVDAEDYINRIPATIPGVKKMGYSFFGTELRLAKGDEYPIRTYLDFEANVEEKELDPMSSLLEIMAKLDPRETVWVQILMRPVDDTWKKKGDKTIKDLQEKAGRQQAKTEAGTFVWTMPTPGEIEMLKAIDRNISKPGFQTLIRFIYFAPNEIYTDTFPRRGIIGAFNQYASESMNKFVHNFKAWTRADVWHWPRIYPSKRLKARRERMLANYRQRRILNDSKMETLLNIKFWDWGFKAQKLGKMILNVEELATIFHLPTFVIMTSHLLKRIESRKVGPPIGLPMFGGEDDELPGIKINKDKGKKSESLYD
mgnify:FL=1